MRSGSSAAGAVNTPTASADSELKRPCGRCDYTTRRQWRDRRDSPAGVRFANSLAAATCPQSPRLSPPRRPATPGNAGARRDSRRSCCGFRRGAHTAAVGPETRVRNWELSWLAPGSQVGPLLAAAGRDAAANMLAMQTAKIVRRMPISTLHATNYTSRVPRNSREIGRTPAPDGAPWVSEVCARGWHLGLPPAEGKSAVVKRYFGGGPEWRSCRGPCWIMQLGGSSG